MVELIQSTISGCSLALEEFIKAFFVLYVVEVSGIYSWKNFIIWGEFAGFIWGVYELFERIFLFDLEGILLIRIIAIFSHVAYGVVFAFDVWLYLIRENRVLGVLFGLLSVTSHYFWDYSSVFPGDFGLILKVSSYFLLFVGVFWAYKLFKSFGGCLKTSSALFKDSICSGENVLLINS